MKYKYLALLFVFMICSCGTEYFEDNQSVENEQANETKTRSISFAVDSNNFALTKADTKTLSDHVSCLQYWIFNEDYTSVKASGVQKSTDSNFGSFTVDLENGYTYHVVVIGHNNKGEMSLGDGNLIMLSSSDEYNTETYYGNTECTVTSSGASNTTISLSYNVCRLRVISKTTHTNVGVVKMSLNSYGTDFYANTGFTSSQKATTDITFKITERYQKSDYLTFTILFPLPSNDEYNDVSTTFTVYGLDEETVLNTVTLSEIPAKIGRNVVYTGNLLQNTQNFTVEIPSSSWDTYNKTY